MATDEFASFSDIFRQQYEQPVRLLASGRNLLGGSRPIINFDPEIMSRIHEKCSRMIAEYNCEPETLIIDSGSYNKLTGGILVESVNCNTSRLNIIVLPQTNTRIQVISNNRDNLTILTRYPNE